MEAKELRIGNWYHDEGLNKDFQANGICIYTLQIIEESEDYRDIPLTSEWLLAFGFYVKGNTWSSSRPTHTNIPSLVLENMLDRGEYMLLDSKYGTHIKHVHQLQNLYHAITGAELVLR